MKKLIYIVAAVVMLLPIAANAGTTLPKLTAENPGKKVAIVSLSANNFGNSLQGWNTALTSDLMGSLVNVRQKVVLGGFEGAVQSVAGFASLHCAITLLVALMVQYTLRNKVLHIVFWTNFAITVVATLYFGWHYIADDLAGVVIALFSFWLGGLASGQKFDRHGLASHPTSTTSQVPVDAE